MSTFIDWRPQRVPRRAVRSGITLIEILVIFSIMGMVAAVLLDDGSGRVRREILGRLRNWQPTADDRRVPTASAWVYDVELVGDWKLSQRCSGSKFQIETSTSLMPNEYVVRFTTGRCGGSCELERKAWFANGVLRLNGAVCEAFRLFPFDTLYPIRIGEETYLLTAPDVEAFDAAWDDELGELAESFHKKWKLFQRRPGKIER